MEEQKIKSIDHAFQVLSAVAERFVGNYQDHMLIQAALSFLRDRLNNPLEPNERDY
jgi:hypothetical protein